MVQLELRVGIALTQRIKQEDKCPTKQANSWHSHPLLSSNLSGIKTSIALLNINVCRTLNTFEPSQRRRIKEVPFKGLFPPDHRAQSHPFALWWSHYKLLLYLRFISTLCWIISGDLCKYFRSPQTDYAEQHKDGELCELPLLFSLFMWHH